MLQGRRPVAAVIAVIIAAAIIGGGTALGRAGDLDPQFDGDGIVTTEGSRFVAPSAIEGTGIHDVLLDPQGRLVITGFVKKEDKEVVVAARYAPDGTLDASFDGDGLVAINSLEQWGRGNALALQPDGKILIGGRAGEVPDTQFLVVRLWSNGELDTSFDDDGIAITDLGATADEAHDLLVQPDGKILAGGGAEQAGRSSFGLARYLPGGALDTTFGSGGKIVMPWTSPQTTHYNGAIRSLAITGGSPNLRILAAGGAANGGVDTPAGRNRGGTHDFVIAGFKEEDGSLDPMFGTGGRVTTATPHSLSDGIDEIAVYPDGRILAAGSSQSGSETSARFALARYMAGGDLDESFGDAGFGVHSILGYATGLAIQSDQRILVSGVGTHHALPTTGGSLNTFGSFTLGRYAADGFADSTFGIGGKVTTDFIGYAGAMALQPDGKAVLAGHDSTTGYRSAVLMRFITDSGFGLSVSPVASSGPVGASHTLTASVASPDNRPAGGVSVRFTVSGANISTGSAVTDADGKANFSYSGLLAGTDSITAYADLSGDLIHQEGEPLATAQRTWSNPSGGGPPGGGPPDAEGPSVASIDPGSGPTSGGTRVRIAGANLGSATAVLFGQAEVTALCGAGGGTGDSPCFTQYSESEVHVYSPKVPAPARVHVRVRTPQATSPETIADLFDYKSDAPLLKTHLTQTSGPSKGGLDPSSGGLSTAAGSPPATPGGPPSLASNLSSSLSTTQAPISAGVQASQSQGASPTVVEKVLQSAGGGAYSVERNAEGAPSTAGFLFSRPSGYGDSGGWLLGLCVATLLGSCLIVGRTGRLDGQARPGVAAGWAR